jgi:hypothetical protein
LEVWVLREVSRSSTFPLASIQPEGVLNPAAL